jgi:hypothetical protein
MKGEIVMTTQHTPGPWHVSDPECCNEVIDEMGRTIAVVEEWTSEGRGNVKVLAAAPDLLKALEEALPWMEHAQKQWTEERGNENSVLSWRITDARNAIAKAKGEKQ